MSLSTRSTPRRFIARNRIKAKEPDQIMMTITPKRFQPNPQNDSKPPSYRIPESLLKMGADKTPQVPPPRWTVQKRKKETAITKYFTINIAFTDSAWWDPQLKIGLWRVFETWPLQWQDSPITARLKKVTRRPHLLALFYFMDTMVHPLNPCYKVLTLDISRTDEHSCLSLLMCQVNYCF